MHREETPPSPKGGNGRDERGRFAPGYVGGPGNPHARQVARLRSLILKSATDDRMEAVAEKLWELAAGGDLAAVKILFAYTIGRPSDPIDPDRLDVQEDALAFERADAKAKGDVGRLVLSNGHRRP